MYRPLDLAENILTAAVARVGGRKAWNRLALDAKLDICRAEAWLFVQKRFESGPVHVSDLFEAMKLIYSMDEL